ncbi:GNAT family N-acetyltransferase [Nitrincola sp.]|uniref:GNAT family N-acetyltransferase n=1 Tax=Nitrincola sp. TaxID=1926584 RepID=UPI003A95B463
MDLSNWPGAPRPERVTLQGKYVRLDPLSEATHGANLFSAAVEPGADDRFRYLPNTTPPDYPTFADWLQKSEASTDPMFFAVIDMRTGRAEGRQALMRIDADNGVAEVGHILWCPAIARSSVPTEAIFLMAQYLFDELGYRRFEWKCDNQNLPSKRAAERFGFVFEGIFRNHLVVKGKNRDTAWFAMTDEDWKLVKPAYLAWLDPDNFDSNGQQRSKLGTVAATRS